MDAIIWGHRGSRLRAPENTIESFLAAEEDGADGVELDVHLSADGHAVVIHDRELRRTTGAPGTVSALHLHALTSISADKGFPGPSRPERRLPSLDAVLGALSQKTLVNVEIKSHPTYPMSRVASLANAVFTVLRRHDRLSSSLVSSFDPRALDAVKAIDRRLKTGWLLSPIISFGPRFPGKPRKFDALHPHFSCVTPFLVERSKKRGLALNVWTVNSNLHGSILAAMGVDGLITDRPVAFRRRQSEPSPAMALMVS